MPNRAESGLLSRAASGDAQAWQDVLTQHQTRLRRMVALRLDSRLKGRVDPSDVLQETYLAAAAGLADYLRTPTMPFYLWLRGIASNKLLQIHRYHLGTYRRDASRDVPLESCERLHASSAALAAGLLGRDTRPSEAVIRAEMRVRLHEALDLMDPIDREVLALRHFEQLTTPEVARVLDVSRAAAGKRYLRALERLKQILVGLPGGLDGLSI